MIADLQIACKQDLIAPSQGVRGEWAGKGGAFPLLKCYLKPQQGRKAVLLSLCSAAVYVHARILRYLHLSAFLNPEVSSPQITIFSTFPFPQYNTGSKDEEAAISSHYTQL